MSNLLLAEKIHLSGVLEDLSLCLKTREVLRIQGASGSGKSSVLKALIRATPHHHSDVTLEGQRIQPANIAWFRSRVHYFSQLMQTPDVTIQEFLSSPFCFRLHGKKDFDSVQAQNYLNRFGLSHVRLDSPLRKLSGGELQRTGLIRSLLLKPQVLLLDEPFSALDPKTAGHTLEEILQIHSQSHSDWGIILISHTEPSHSYSFSEKHIEKGRWIE